MKKILIFGFLAFLGFAPHVFAQGFTALAPIPGLTDISPTAVIDGSVLALFFNNLYKYLIGLAATLAVIEIIWAGLDISFFHKDAVSAIVDDKGRIYNAIFGLILVLSPYLVFYIINPSILNLSLNLPPIRLAVPSTSGTGALSIPGTGTVCSGYSEYRSAIITPPQYCVDKFGAGWVNIDAVCCSGQAAGTNSCCGMQSNYVAPVTTTPIVIPGGETVYTDVAKIPTGSWCYKVNIYGAVFTTTQYVCAADKNTCLSLTASEQGTITSSCKTY